MNSIVHHVNKTTTTYFKPVESSTILHVESHSNILTLSRYPLKVSVGRRCHFIYYVRRVKFKIKIKKELVQLVPYTLQLYLLLITSKCGFQIPYVIECKWFIIGKMRWYGSAITLVPPISSCY